MKNWILANSCSRIFKKSINGEMIFLHTQHCIDKVKSCPDLLPYYEVEMVNYDGAIWHTPIKDFIIDGEISWKELGRNFNIR